MTKVLIQSIFGSYVPLSYLDEAGNLIYVSGVAGVDWEYVLGVLGFFVTLYAVLRIIGGVIRNV